jgi:hypothetical protein
MDSMVAENLLDKKNPDQDRQALINRQRMGVRTDKQRGRVRAVAKLRARTAEALFAAEQALRGCRLRRLRRLPLLAELPHFPSFPS